MTHADVAHRQGCPTHMLILRYFTSTESEFDSLPQQVRIVSSVNPDSKCKLNFI
jgi:hypothetical protein